uniref:C2H2-type domain-containing protein n=1 Tax=Fundulus heteroclitus TaxID=8078 RepID=A0A3Q2NSB8_FUNHE
MPKRRFGEAPLTSPRKKPRNKDKMFWSVDDVKHVTKIKGRLLLRSPNKVDCRPSTPVTTITRHVPRRKLFPTKEDDLCIIFLSTEPSWKRQMRNRSLRLPTSVTVGIRSPWTPQSCPLCKICLTTASYAASHMGRIHRARKIDYFCRKCGSLKYSLKSAAVHSAKCRLQKHSKQETGLFKCDYCPNAFASVRGRSLHMRRKHSGAMPTRIKLSDVLDDQAGKTRSYHSPELILESSCLNSSPSDDGVTRSMKETFEMVLSNESDNTRGLHPLHTTFKELMVYTKRLVKFFKRKANTPVKDQRRRNSGQNAKTKRSKRQSYRILQRLYARDKSAAEGTDGYAGLGTFQDLPATDNKLLIWPLTAEEVLSATKGMRKKSAPGPDMIKLSDLMSWDPLGSKLSTLFNTMLYIGKLPTCLKVSRTTLIPKTSTAAELRKVENWRPITISSVIVWILSNVLAKRMLEACPLHRSQKGFVGGRGCAENLMILKGLLLDGKRLRKPLAMVFVDLARAFDSVSHTHTRQVLHDRGVDETLISLFNMAMDPLLHYLERNGTSYELAGQQITSLAYADDLVLVSSSWRGMKRNLKILQEFLATTRLKVKISKCGGFFFQMKGSCRVLNQCEAWKIGDEPIPILGPNKVKYLVVQINPVGWLIPPDLVPSVMEMLNSFALPRITYAADVGMVKKGTLKLTDNLIRKAVKRWLHLEPSTADGLIYSRPREGGLGVVRLEDQIPMLQFRRVIGLIQAKDELCSNMAKSVVDHNRLNKLYRRVMGVSERKSDLNCEPDKIQIGDFTSLAWRRREFARWTRLKSQGRGILPFQEDRISNCWLKLPTSFQESEFILGLKLRTNTVPMPTSPSVRKAEQTKCRLCGKAAETLGHVISSCKVLQKNRMKNHNKICKLLAELAASKGWSVLSEKRLFSPEAGKGEPDLIMTKNKISLVADVALCYDNSQEYLSMMGELKKNKYIPFRGAIQAALGSDSVEFFGFPMGTKGKWHKGNFKLLDGLGFNKVQRTPLRRRFSRRMDSKSFYAAITNNFQALTSLSCLL